MSTIGDDDGVGEWKEVMINSGDEQCRVQILAIFVCYYFCGEIVVFRFWWRKLRI